MKKNWNHIEAKSKLLVNAVPSPIKVDRSWWNFHVSLSNPNKGTVKHGIIHINEIYIISFAVIDVILELELGNVWFLIYIWIRIMLILWKHNMGVTPSVWPPFLELGSPRGMWHLVVIIWIHWWFIFLFLLLFFALVEVFYYSQF